MSKDIKNVTKQLKALKESIDLLTKVTAISVGKETIFRGMKETGDKVKALEGFEFPDKIIAMLVGSTPDSVKSLRSQKKARVKKPPQIEPKKEEVEHR